MQYYMTHVAGPGRAEQHRAGQSRAEAASHVSGRPAGIDVSGRPTGIAGGPKEGYGELLQRQSGVSFLLDGDPAGSAAGAARGSSTARLQPQPMPTLQAEPLRNHSAALAAVTAKKQAAVAGPVQPLVWGGGVGGIREGGGSSSLMPAPAPALAAPAAPAPASSAPLAPAPTSALSAALPTSTMQYFEQRYGHSLLAGEGGGRAGLAGPVSVSVPHRAAVTYEAPVALAEQRQRRQHVGGMDERAGGGPGVQARGSQAELASGGSRGAPVPGGAATAGARVMKAKVTRMVKLGQQQQASGGGGQGAGVQGRAGTGFKPRAGVRTPRSLLELR